MIKRTNPDVLHVDRRATRLLRYIERLLRELIQDTVLNRHDEVVAAAKRAVTGLAPQLHFRGRAATVVHVKERELQDNQLLPFLRTVAYEFQGTGPRLRFRCIDVRSKDGAVIRAMGGAQLKRAWRHVTGRAEGIGVMLITWFGRHLVRATGFPICRVCFRVNETLVVGDEYRVVPLDCFRSKAIARIARSLVQVFDMFLRIGNDFIPDLRLIHKMDRSAGCPFGFHGGSVPVPGVEVWRW